MKAGTRGGACSRSGKTTCDKDIGAVFASSQQPLVTETWELSTQALSSSRLQVQTVRGTGGHYAAMRLLYLCSRPVCLAHLNTS